jgi:hypothetical protein
VFSRQRFPVSVPFHDFFNLTQFVKDASGKVTHVIVRSDAGEEKAVRKARN